MPSTASYSSKADAAKAFIESGIISHRPCPTEELRRRVAEAAYYRAEKRGFSPGHELEDWLEAEKEIRQRQSPPPD